MACGSCGTGKPNGCKSNGGCSTGGCNRMNVYDWLKDMPISDWEDSCKVVELSFKNGSRKDFCKNTGGYVLEKGELVTIESSAGGFDVGEVSLTGELVRLQLKKNNVSEFSPEIKRIMRKSSEKDIEMYLSNKYKEKSTLAKSREIAIQLKLQMKLSEVEIQADGKKVTFFYTADDRVDFRELIKEFANEFKAKIEMRQIGIRQEAAKVGGIGSCGRELCCSTWITDFKSVNTTAARYQNLSINQSKLSGQCGRLKCCLNYELDTYLDALQEFPENADTLEISRGKAILAKKDIFKNLMWYTIQGSSQQYPLTIERVLEIKKLNTSGVIPEELNPVDLSIQKNSKAEPAYQDLVGQISLRSLDKKERRNQNEKRAEQRDRGERKTENTKGVENSRELPKKDNPKRERNSVPNTNDASRAQRPIKESKINTLDIHNVFAQDPKPNFNSPQRSNQATQEGGESYFQRKQNKQQPKKQPNTQHQQRPNNNRNNGGPRKEEKPIPPVE